MAKDIHYECSGKIDCSKLSDEQREAQLARLRAANHAGALEGLILADVRANTPELLDKWVGMTGTLKAH